MNRRGPRRAHLNMRRALHWGLPNGETRVVVTITWRNEGQAARLLHTHLGRLERVLAEETEHLEIVATWVDEHLEPIETPAN